MAHKALCSSSLYSQASKYYGHECGNVIRKQWPGPSNDKTNKGPVLCGCESQQLLREPDKGLEEMIEPGLNVALPWDLLPDSEASFDGVLENEIKPGGALGSDDIRMFIDCRSENKRGTKYPELVLQHPSSGISLDRRRQDKLYGGIVGAAMIGRSRGGSEGLLGAAWFQSLLNELPEFSSLGRYPRIPDMDGSEQKILSLLLSATILQDSLPSQVEGAAASQVGWQPCQQWSCGLQL